MKLVVTIDTEEDNWAEFRPTGQTVRNIQRIPGLQRLFDDFGVTPTYLVTHAVAADEAASGVLRSIVAAGRCEVGAHCHPWNTPPFHEPESRHPRRDSMLCNLPAWLQHAKIARLHETIERSLGLRPVTFRCGRWAFSPTVSQHLADLGYRIDTSVTPYMNWTDDHGPDFSTISPRPFRLAPLLVEVPVTIGFLQSNFALRNLALRAVLRRPVNRLRLAGVLYRLGLASKVWLSPEVSTARQMIRLTKQVRRESYGVLNLTFHSPCLQAGLTPFVRSRADERRLVRRLREYLTFARSVGITPITLSEAAVPNGSSPAHLPDLGPSAERVVAG
jgi:hypothetical protein